MKIPILYRGSFSEKLPNSNHIKIFRECVEKQDAVILFTSGSTGKPKGVVFRMEHCSVQARLWIALMAGVAMIAF